MSHCHGVAMLGWKNWEEPFGRSIGSYLQLEKTGAEQERQSGDRGGD